MSLEKFGHLRHRCPDIEVGIGASPMEIEQAQLALKVQFSRSYVKFLSLYGWAKIKSASIYGLGPGIPDFLSVVNNTIDEREAVEPPLPIFLIPIMNDGSGNHYCLDSSQIREGEMPIVFWYHEASTGRFQKPEVVSPTFDSWLCDKADFLVG